MEKYLLTNWETVPFKKKSFEGQLDRYLKVCVASVDSPHRVLHILPLYGKECRGGFSDLIEEVRNYEICKEKGEPCSPPSFMSKPVEGGFEEIPSLHGALFRRFTPDEARYGLCHPNDVWKAERMENGKVKVYHTIKVFCLYKKNNKIGQRYLNGWFPNELYRHYYGYSYLPLSDLTEPLQL